MMKEPLRHHNYKNLEGAWASSDFFGKEAERFARFFGTPKFLVGQSLMILIWIALNIIGIIGQWDPYPFILLNLLFSTQAAYAAPLILLAQNRQAEREKAIAEAHAKQLQEESDETHRMLTEIHAATCSDPRGSGS